MNCFFTVIPLLPPGMWDEFYHMARYTETLGSPSKPGLPGIRRTGAAQGINKSLEDHSNVPCTLSISTKIPAGVSGGLSLLERKGIYLALR